MVQRFSAHTGITFPIHWLTRHFTLNYLLWSAMGKDSPSSPSSLRFATSGLRPDTPTSAFVGNRLMAVIEFYDLPTR
jgi:hypothetical protein